MNWRKSGWTLFPIIAIVLVAYLLIPSCAESRPLLLVYEDCKGKTDYVEVEIRVSNAPTIECVRMAPEYGLSPIWFAIQIPVACSLRRDNKALVILPPLAPVWMVIHELMHSVGLSHGLLPEPMECP